MVDLPSGGLILVDGGRMGSVAGVGCVDLPLCRNVCDVQKLCDCEVS